MIWVYFFSKKTLLLTDVNTVKLMKEVQFLLSKNKSILLHSSEIRHLCLMKLSSKMLQNWLYFWNKKIQLVFFVFHFEQLWIFNSECPDLCWHRPRHPLLKIQSCLKEKNYLGFLTPKIWQSLKRFAKQYYQA